MSLGSKMASLESKGRFAIWKRTSSPQDVRVIRKDIMRYMSEHTKEGVDVVASHAQNHPNWLKDGVDYLTKEEQGKLKVYGFLRDDVIRRTGQFPHRMKNDDLVEACLEAWEARLKKKNIKRVAHKYVLSLNPEMCEVMAKTGHSADELLTQAVRKTVRKYQEKYYPAEKVGYLVGIHHDKAHLHAHVMLFPTTEKGKLLLVTDYSRKDKVNGNKRPFTDMRKFAEREVTRYYQREIKTPFRASERNPSKYVQPKLLSWLAYQRSNVEKDNSHLDPDEQRTWMYNEREKVLGGDQRELQRSLHEAYKSADSMFDHLLKTKKGQNPQAYESRKLQVAEERTQLADELKGLFAEMKELKAESQGNARTRRQLYQDMGNWSHFRFNYGTITEGGNSLRDHEVFDWAKQKIAGSDTLGSLIKDWVDEKRARNEEVNLPKEMLQIMASADNPVAARKFTEKDKYARKCITYGAGKLKDPSIHMLDHYYRQSAFLSNHSQKDFVREFLKSSIRVQREEQKEIQRRRDEINRKIKEIRVQQQSNKFKQDMIAAVEKGRRPSFLEEYKHWQDIGAEIPTQALQPMRAGVLDKRSESGDSKLSSRPDGDFSTRLHQTLQDLRASRMQTGNLTLVGNMRAYHERGSDPTATLHSNRERVVDSTLNREANAFLQPRRDGSNRTVQEEDLAEKRRKQVRDSRMQHEEVGVLDR